MEPESPPIALLRSSLLVNGDVPQQVAGAGRFGAAQVVLDLADLDPGDKDVARAGIVEALRSNDYGEALVAVRVNQVGSMWCYRDIVDVVEGVGEFVDGIVVPQVHSPDDVTFVDTLLGMIEQRLDLGHRIDIDVEIATAPALALLDEIALASDRLQALVLDEPAMLAALGADPAFDVAERLLEGVRARVLVTARAAGLQAITAPNVADGDDAERAAFETAGALGFDGARCTHPRQVALAAKAFDRS